MSFNIGSIDQFTDSASVMDPVVLTAAKAVNLPVLVGRFYNSLSAPSVSITQQQFEIFSRSLTVRDGVLGASAWDDDDTTGLSVSDTAADGLTLGMVLKIGSEVVVVKSVNRAANTIEVFSRGWGGSTAASHDAAASFSCIGYAGRDIDLKNVESFSENTMKYTNAVQTVFEAIDYTKMGTLSRKGLDPDRQHLIAYQEAMFRVARNLSRMAILGRKHIPVSNDLPFGSAGLLEQLQDTASGSRPVLTYDLTSAGGVFSEDVLKTALDNVFAYGSPTKIWCSQKSKKYFDSFISGNAAAQFAVNLAETTAGYEVSKYRYNGVILDIEVDADMPDDSIAITNPTKIHAGWLEGDTLKCTKQPTKSDREFREAFQGSIGFSVDEVGYEHLLIKGITSGATERVHKTIVTNTVANPVHTRNSVDSVVIVNADSELAALATAGQRVKIGTAWTSGTAIVTAVLDECWIFGGSTWTKYA